MKQNQILDSSDKTIYIDTMKKQKDEVGVCLRTPKAIHNAAKKMAQKHGMSMNTYVVRAVARLNDELKKIEPVA